MQRNKNRKGLQGLKPIHFANRRMGKKAWIMPIEPIKGIKGPTTFTQNLSRK